MKWIDYLLKSPSYGRSADLGLLVLRMGISLMMMTHGWPKLISFSEKADGFYNFLGLGGPVSLALTVFAEFFCSVILIMGLGTRIVLIPLIIMMVVIVFGVNGHAPFHDKELGLLYLLVYLCLFLTGPGRFSIDYWIQSNRK